MSHALDRIFQNLDGEKRSREIIGPIRQAAGNFVPPHPFPRTFEEFIADVGGYYQHLHAAYYHVSKNCMDLRLAYGYGVKALGVVFEKEGGWVYARELAEMESFEAIKSAITEFFIRDVTHNLDNVAVHLEINPRDPEQRKSVLDEYSRRYNQEYESTWEYYNALSHLEHNLAEHKRKEEELKRRRKYGI